MTASGLVEPGPVSVKGTSGIRGRWRCVPRLSPLCTLPFLSQSPLGPVQWGGERIELQAEIVFAFV